MTVTIATLRTSTAQEVFDHVAKHLLKQGKKSILQGMCAYSNGFGLSCAAGCLFTDKEMDTLLLAEPYANEGTGWDTLIERNAVPSTHEELILALQHIHDGTDPADWKEWLIELARDKGFTMPNMGETK